jgi:SAM-dependent methyltransferase
VSQPPGPGTSTAGRGPQDWDDRYREDPGPAAPHPAVMDALLGVAAGRALDIACGTGRHSLWLAEQGWDVTAVDFSRVGVEILARAAEGRGLAVDAHVADARTWTPPRPGYDLVLMSFVHLPDLLATAAGWLAPQGRLLVVGHSTRTPDGTGPRDPRLRLDRVDLAARVTGARLRVLRAADVERDTADGVSTDVVVLAQKPA